MIFGNRLASLLVLTVGLAASTSPTMAQGSFSSPGAGSKPAWSSPSKSVPWAQSAWVKGHNSAVRLIGGVLPGADGGRRLVLGVELAIAEGWKTYWRNPGDDGGLPPSFGWDQSRNLKSAEVKFPLPERLKSVGGTAIGYAKPVLFPVEIVPLDASRPVEVALDLEYGICKDICVPAEAKLTLVLDTSLAAMPPELAGSLARVPQPVSGEAAAKILKSAKATLSGPNPAIVFEIAAAAGAPVDLFVEPVVGMQLPVPAKVGDAGGVRRFRIDLKGVEDAAKLAGSTMRLTVKDASGAWEIPWVVKG